MNALTTQRRSALITADDADVLRVMRDTLYPGARADSVEMVLAYCRARDLDPMLKPVHIVPMWVDGGMRDVPLPGIALYRIQAARSGRYTGKSEPEFGPDVTRDFDKGGAKSGPNTATVTFPAWCKITVYRDGQPYSATERWLENYATAGRNTEMPNEMWRKRPYGQLAKCAEAQALRMAFPELVGGDPTAEEMEGKAFIRDVPNTAPAGPLSSMHAPADEALTIFDSDGVEHTIRASKMNPAIYIWLGAARKAVGKLEDVGAVREWRAAMAPHLAEMSDTYPGEVAAVEELCSTRIEALTLADGDGADPDLALPE